jgi:hypothetical protein
MQERPSHDLPRRAEHVLWAHRLTVHHDDEFRFDSDRRQGGRAMRGRDAATSPSR